MCRPTTTATCEPVALLARGCWHLDETTGTTALDASPNANNGTYLNGPLLGVPGKFLNAVLMDGVNDLVRVPSAASLEVGDTFSIEGWVKRTSTARSEDLFNKGGNGFQLTVMSAPNANQVFLRKANVSTVVRSTAGVAAGAYHHVVATKNGAGAGTSKIYIDGVEAGTVAVSAAQVIQNNTQPLLFGLLNSSSIDEFAVYDRALTAGEVSARFAAGPP